MDRVGPQGYPWEAKVPSGEGPWTAASEIHAITKRSDTPNFSGNQVNEQPLPGMHGHWVRAREPAAPMVEPQVNWPDERGCHVQQADASGASK